MADGEGAPGVIRSYSGGAHEELGRLKSDNHRYRLERKKLKAEIEELTKTNAEIAKRALSADDFKRWETLKDVTLKPDEITAALKERDELKVKVEDAEKDAQVAEAAEALSWKPGVLKRLVKSEGLHLEWREVERPKKDDPKGTEKVRMAHVRPAADERAELKPLDKYVESHLADFVPALTAKDSEQGSGQRRETQGVPYPTQPTGGTAPTNGVPREQVEARKRASGVYGF